MPYDCQTCGACCISVYDSPTYVDVSIEDVKRMTLLQRAKYVVDDPHRQWSHLATRVEPKTGRIICAAHRGTTGKTSSCEIYTKRPDLCRSFRPGNPACRQARADIGLPRGPT